MEKMFPVLDSEDELNGSEGDRSSPMTGLPLLALCAGLCLAVLLVALDNTIITTAIPKIVDEFDALDSVGWYVSAYLLTTCALQLSFGKLYTIFPIKLVFLLSIIIFEIGSAVCGAASNSTALIVGRATAGPGAAGIFSGALVILSHSVPVEKVPIYNGLLLSMFGVASIIGPLLGGAFTDYVSWRWCFYINLPVGAISIATTIIFLTIPESTSTQAERTGILRHDHLDLAGTLTLVPGVVSLLLACQWGGTTYTWSSGRIIALLTLFGVLLVAFIIIQVWRRNGTVPLHIVCQRTMAFSYMFSFFLGGAFFTLVFFLPLWFQEIKGVSATESGVMCIPFLLSMILATILTGIVITLHGLYVPFFYLSAVLSSIGAGLLTTFTKETGSARWIGYQILCGAGIGFGFQLSVVAAQVVLALDDVAIGTALAVFFLNLGGSIFTSACQSIFLNRISTGIQKAAPGIDASSIVHAGAISVDSAIPAGLRPVLKPVFNSALTTSWYLPTALAACSILGAIGVERRKLECHARPTTV